MQEWHCGFDTHVHVVDVWVWTVLCFSPDVDEQNRSIGAEGVQGTAQAAADSKDAVTPTTTATQPPTSSSQPDLGNFNMCLAKNNTFSFHIKI